MAVAAEAAKYQTMLCGVAAFAFGFLSFATWTALSASTFKELASWSAYPFPSAYIGFCLALFGVIFLAMGFAQVLNRVYDCFSRSSKDDEEESEDNDYCQACFQETDLPSDLAPNSKMSFRAYPQTRDGIQVVVYYKKGEDIAGIVGAKGIPVRVHSECLTGDVFSSSKCDCGQQLHNFLSFVDKTPQGVLIYIKGHEGRGAGLINKISAYARMDADPGLHHITALQQCGCESDTRSYESAARALIDLGVSSIRLHTNNPKKVAAMEEFLGKGNVVQDVIPSSPTAWNAKYLREKEEDCGHCGLLSSSSDADDSSSAARSSQGVPSTVIDATPVVNNITFAVAELAGQAKEFYEEHGFAVASEVIGEDTCDLLIHAINEHKKSKAEFLNIPYETYRREISQHRDLHNSAEGSCFFDVMKEVAEKVVLPLTGWPGATLFHDHVIQKPHGGENKAIPGHQDSMFWPVDAPGLSVWLALEPVEPRGGCLEVIDGSHKSGTCDDPIDFMAPEVPFADKFPGEKHVWLPVQAGSAVVLHSLTYHRSSPKLDSGDRPVYLMLWVPKCTRWRPDLVDWHPINEHLKEANVKCEDKLCSLPYRHPSFGKCGESAECCEPREPLHRGTRNTEAGITMYNASKKTAAQLRQILQLDGDDTTCAAKLCQDKKELIFERLCKTGVCSACQKEAFVGIMDRLRLCFEAYDKFKARNVYNSAFADWWSIAGEGWETHWCLGKLSDNEAKMYLDLIGVCQEKDGKPRAADLAFLTDIVSRTFATIPFNNFEMLVDSPRVRPTKQKIVDAMISGTGGLCTVRNPFLYMLLNTLGFVVEFLSCTIHDAGQEPLRDAHIALLVTLGDWDDERVWVDVGNGYPYTRPLSIDNVLDGQEEKIEHPFLSIKLVRVGSEIHIQHLLPGAQWITNNTFALTGKGAQAAPRFAKYSAFDALHFKHYAGVFGPFLTGLRFNLFTEDDYVVLRYNESSGLSVATSARVATSGTPARQIEDVIKLSGASCEWQAALRATSNVERFDGLLHRAMEALSIQ